MNRGFLLKTLREGVGMSQTEAAEHVGISKQLLYKYEKNNITNIPSNVVEKLATLYNTSPSYIMGWSPEDTEYSIFEDIILTENYEIWDDSSPEVYSSRWEKHIEWNNKGPNDSMSVVKFNMHGDMIFNKSLTLAEIQYIVETIRAYVFKYVRSDNPSKIPLMNMSKEEKELLRAYRSAAPETQAIVNKIFDIKGDTESETAESIVS